MAKEDKDGDEVVPGMFGGKGTVEHLIRHLRKDANSEGPAILIFEDKKGDIIPVLLNISVEDCCFFSKVLDNTITTLMSDDDDWKEVD
jgi:hypothetical protein